MAKKTMAAIGIALFSLILCEALLQVLYHTSPTVRGLLSPPREIPLLKDPRLGHRPNPAHPEHDAWGFRNPGVPAHVEMVALGDSQTYGTSVPVATQSWPVQFSTITGIQTYNMAYGGYSPVHSLILWEQAMQLHPSMVIEGMYAGNDLYDAFERVYYGGQLPELKSTRPDIVAAIQLLENDHPMRIGPLFPKIKPTPPGLVDFLSGHSRIYGLLRAVKHAMDIRSPSLFEHIYWQQAKTAATPFPHYFYIFEHGQYKTIFMTKNRILALNLDDARVKEGFHLCMGAIKLMGKRARRRGIMFAVLLIPTKALVFEPVVRQANPHPDPGFVRLVAYEKRMWRQAKRTLDRWGIPYIDALPQLRHTLLSGTQPYWASADGHPNAAGYLAIAESVAAWAKSMGARK